MVEFLRNIITKKLKNNLLKEDWSNTLEILKDNGYDENSRAEDISYEVFVKIFNKLNK